jgi:hypothetical protein
MAQMTNAPSFMPRQPTFLRIEVTSDDADETFENQFALL